MNQGVRGGKVTELKKTVDTAVQSCPTVRHVFVAMRTETLVPMTDRDVLMDEVRRVPCSKKKKKNVLRLISSCHFQMSHRIILTHKGF